MLVCQALMSIISHSIAPHANVARSSSFTCLRLHRGISTCGAFISTVSDYYTQNAPLTYFLSHSLSVHLWLEVIGGHPGWRHHESLLLTEGLLTTTIEEERHVRILFSLCAQKMRNYGPFQIWDLSLPYLKELPSKLSENHKSLKLDHQNSI